MNFEEKMNELNKILEEMSKNTLSLGETMKNYEKAKALIEELKEEINKAEEKIDEYID